MRKVLTQLAVIAVVVISGAYLARMVRDSYRRTDAPVAEKALSSEPSGLPPAVEPPAAKDPGTNSPPIAPKGPPPAEKKGVAVAPSTLPEKAQAESVSKAEAPKTAPMPTVTWSLAAREGAEATLSPLADLPNGMRVVIAKLGTGQGWQVQLAREQLILQPNTVYQLTFRARGDRPRQAIVAVAERAAPFRPLGLYQDVSLGTAWQERRIEFLSEPFAGAARLYFDLGTSAIATDIADVVLQSRPWMLKVHAGCQATMSEGEKGTPIRVVIPRANSAEPWRVQLIRMPIAIEKGKTYSVGFRARADSPRRVDFAASGGREPFRPLGFFQTILLQPTWKDFHFQFAATDSDAAGRFYFDLASGNQPIEIDGFTWKAD